MSNLRWNAVMWRVVLGVVTISFAALACAQSAPSPNESSSLQLAEMSGALASPSASMVGASGYRADNDRQPGNWRQHLTHGLNFAAEIGGGFNAPIGNDIPFITWGGNFTIGGGVHFNKYLSMLAEYQFIGDKLPGGLIADAGAVGGHAHIWSLTLDPVFDLFPDSVNSVYITGGGGFYRKVTSFTDPVEVYQCYYFCYTGVENVVVSHFSSNQGGMNIGFGITHRVGGAYSTGKMKIFAEARYLFVDTPKIGEPNGLGTTGLIPVTFGLRW